MVGMDMRLGGFGRASTFKGDATPPLNILFESVEGAPCAGDALATGAFWMMIDLRLDKQAYASLVASITT